MSQPRSDDMQACPLPQSDVTGLQGPAQEGSHLVQHADLEHKLPVDEGSGVVSRAHRAQGHLPHAKVGTHMVLLLPMAVVPLQQQVLAQ